MVNVQLLTPKTFFDYCLLAAASVCTYFGGIWGGVPTFLAYLIHILDPKRVGPPTPEAQRVKEIAAPVVQQSEAPPPGKTPPMSAPLVDSPPVAVPFEQSRPASGTDMTVKPLVNHGNTCFAAALAQTYLLRHEAPIREIGDPAKREVRDRLIAFIDAYRNGSPDITPVTEALRMLSRDYREQYDAKASFGLAHFGESITWYIREHGKDQKFQTLLKRYQESPPTDFETLTRELTEVGRGYLCCATPQQDPDEMIGLLHDFIYGDRSDGIRQESSVDVNGEIHTLPTETYNGRWYIPLDKSMQFPVLFQRAFFGKTEYGQTTGLRRDRLSTAPLQLVLPLKRYNRSNEVIQGKIEGIGECCQVPGDYFTDGRPATYRLDGMIIHQGNTPRSGHYWAVVRKLNPDTGESRFFLADDAAIQDLTPKQALAQAGMAYILFYEKIS